MKESQSPFTGSGITGSLKIIAGLCVLVLAVLAALLVLNAIPQEKFQELITKIGLLALIAALATVTIGVLAKVGRR